MAGYISYKLFGLIAFILAFTYVSSAMLYEEYIPATFSPSTFGAAKFDPKISFETFLQFNWEIAMDSLLYDGEHNLREVHSMYFRGDVYAFIQQAYGYHQGELFAEFGSGIDWYNNDEFLDGGLTIGMLSTSPRTQIMASYRSYLRGHGFEYDNITGEITVIQGTLLDDIFGMIAQIPEGIGSAINVATFNFKDKYGNEKIPGEIRTIMTIFMFPCWLIMILGLLPLFIAAIDAFGRILDALTPLT